MKGRVTMKILKKMIEVLLRYYYQKHPFLTWSIEVDRHTDIHLITEEWDNKGHRFGTEEETYDDQDNE